MKRKALWTTLPGAKRPKPSSRAADEKRYRERVKEWLIENPACFAFWRDVNCDPHATQVHHKHGRVGNLLLKESLWVPVCARGHAWIHSNIASARALDLYAPKGQWNRPPA